MLTFAEWTPEQLDRLTRDILAEIFVEKGYTRNVRLVQFDLEMDESERHVEMLRKLICNQSTGSMK